MWLLANVAGNGHRGAWGTSSPPAGIGEGNGRQHRTDGSLPAASAPSTSAEVSAIRRLCDENPPAGASGFEAMAPVELQTLCGLTRLLTTLDRIVQPGSDDGCVTVLFHVKAARLDLALVWRLSGTWKFWKWPRLSLQPGHHAAQAIRYLLKGQRQLAPQITDGDRTQPDGDITAASTAEDPSLHRRTSSSSASLGVPRDSFGNSRAMLPSGMQGGEVQGPRSAASNPPLHSSTSRPELLRFYSQQQPNSPTHPATDPTTSSRQGLSTSQNYPTLPPQQQEGQSTPANSLHPPIIQASSGAGDATAPAFDPSQVLPVPYHELLQSVATVENHSRMQLDLYPHTALLDFVSFIYAVLFYQAVITTSHGLVDITNVKVNSPPLLLTQKNLQL